MVDPGMVAETGEQCALGETARERYFPELGGLAYLNTATMAAPPAEAVAALREQVAQWAAGKAGFDLWEDLAEEARGLVAPLLGVEARDVALMPSQVAAASSIARALPAARVVVPEQEFRSNLIPWLHRREDVRLVPSPATTEAICATVDAVRPDLVAVSSVQSADGLRVDLPGLVRHAHERGALVYVDASQSLGVDAALAECDADFIGSVTYKWPLGARGAAFLAIASRHRGRFQPIVAGPGSATDSVDDVHYGAEYTLWDDARRFDQPQAWLPWVATAAGLRLITGYRPADLDAHATGLAARFREEAAKLGLAPAPVDVPSAIVSVAHDDPQAAVARLAAAGVQAAARSTGVRFAFHLYNGESDVDRALGVIRGVVSP